MLQLLNGVQSKTKQDTTMVLDELKRLYDDGDLKKKKQLADKENDGLPKRVIFDNNIAYYIGMNLAVSSKDFIKFRYGMTAVAIAVQPSQWTRLLTDGLEDRELRDTCAAISKQTLELMLKLENKVVIEKRKNKSRGKTSVKALGDRWKTVWKKVCMNPEKKSDLELKTGLERNLGKTGRLKELCQPF